MQRIGLQNHIWKNNTKSIALLISYPVIILAMCWALAYVVSSQGITIVKASENQYASAPTSAYFDETFKSSSKQLSQAEQASAFLFQYWPIIIAVVGIWFAIAYFFQTRMVRSLSHSHPVTRKEEPELYNMLENLCIVAGMKMPRLEIIESHARNAFASGTHDENYTVTMTRGLIQSLTKDEVEAVMAHELTHIINRDVRLLIVTIIFTSMLGFAAQMAWSSARYSLWVPRRHSNSKSKGGGYVLMFAALAILWAGYFATLFTRFALSRKREYMADAGAVQLTRKPEAMMAALMRISGMDHIPKLPADVGFMCIENRKPFLGLFATHPPMDKRIEVISQTTSTPIPRLKPKIRASRSDAAVKPAADRENWTTRERFGRKRNPWTRP